MTTYEDFVQGLNLRPNLFGANAPHATAELTATDSIPKLAQLGLGLVATQAMLSFMLADRLHQTIAMQGDDQHTNRMYIKLLENLDVTPIYEMASHRLVSDSGDVLHSKVYMLEEVASAVMAFKAYVADLSASAYGYWEDGATTRPMNPLLVRAGYQHALRDVVYTYAINKAFEPYCIFKDMSTLKNEMPVEQMTDYVSKLNFATPYELGTLTAKDLKTKVKAPKARPVDHGDAAVAFGKAIDDLLEFLP